MNLKIYEKTNYPGIYRNKKNKNYIVDISAGNKEFDIGRNRTTISTLNGKKGGPKILKISEALNIQRNPEFLDMVKFSSNYSTLVKDVIKEYLDWCKYNEKQAYNTVKKKISRYDCHLVPYVGNKKINKVTEADMLAIHKRLDESDLENESKRNIHKDISAFFNWCVRQKIIPQSPLYNIKNFPKIKKEMKFWSPEEIKTIRNHLKKVNTYWSKTIHLFITIKLSMADRVGETRVLKYSKVNKDSEQINITNSIQYDSSKSNKDSTTKTYQSQRSVDVSNIVLDEIEEYKRFIENTFGVKITKNDYIFMNPQTRLPYSDTALRKYFNYFCKESGVEKIRMYDLRHTGVTLLMLDGYELYQISSRIGHKKYSTTVEQYGHLTTPKKKEIARSTDKYL